MNEVLPQSHSYTKTQTDKQSQEFLGSRNHQSGYLGQQSDRMGRPVA